MIKIEKLPSGWAVIHDRNDGHPDNGKILEVSWTRYGQLCGFPSRRDAQDAYDRCFPPVFERRRGI